MGWGLVAPRLPRRAHVHVVLQGLEGGEAGEVLGGRVVGVGGQVALEQPMLPQHLPQRLPPPQRHPGGERRPSVTPRGTPGVLAAGAAHPDTYLKVLHWARATRARSRSSFMVAVGVSEATRSSELPPAPARLLISPLGLFGQRPR